MWHGLLASTASHSRKWLAYDVAFIAELNSRRAEQLEAAADKQRALLQKALARIEAELDGDNGCRVAMWLMERMGPVQPVGPTDAPGVCERGAAEYASTFSAYRIDRKWRDLWSDVCERELAKEAP